MAYIGKFVDREPVICAAGKVFTDSDATVKNSLFSYTIEDGIDALKHESNIFKEKPSVYLSAPVDYKIRKPSSNNYKGIYTDSREILNNPVKTRYQTIINDLKETSYDSYWNKQLGKCRDPTPGLPAGMIPHAMTFGRPSPLEPKLKEVVNPPINHHTVLWNSQIGHELYVKSHNDYNPSERVHRNYLQPAFNPNKNFGMKTKYDPRGIWFPCCVTWYDQDPESVGTAIQAKHHDRNRSQLGKSLTPNHNINNVPKGYRFGQKTHRAAYGVEELLKDPEIVPQWLKKDIAAWVKHINGLRIKLKKRYGELDFRDFLDQLRFYDKELTGFLPLEIVYNISDIHRIFFNKELLEPFLEYLNIMKEGLVEYLKFVDLLNWQKSFPEVPNVPDTLPEQMSDRFKTQNQIAENDWKIINTNCMPPAGLSTTVFQQDPQYPIGTIKAYKDNLGGETSVAELIYPSIFTQYGISHRDFFQPRQKQVIQRLFEKMGYELNDDLFERLWSIGQQVEKSDMVSVDTFYTLIRKSTIKNKNNNQ